jgi:tetratricopeptide (TPR) repeat protein
MSEALHGGHDSRPSENPQASSGQWTPEAAAAGDAGDAGAGEGHPDQEPPRPDQEPPRADGGHQGPGGDSYAWYRRGLDLLNRGSPAAAAELLERAAAAEPGARSIREALARAQFDAGRYAQAADNFRQNVEAIPSDDYAHFGLGLALARGGNPAAAAEHLALAAAMRPELAHYTEALRGVRATLAARTQARSGASPAPGPDGDEPL